MPYIVEYFERNKWRPIKRTLCPSKKEVEAIVNEMNNLVPPEQIRLLPIKERYRFRKVKSKEFINEPIRNSSNEPTGV